MKTLKKAGRAGCRVRLEPFQAHHLPNASLFHDASPEYFKGLRLSMGLTQKHLASLLGITRRQVIGYETGATRIPYPVQFATEVLELAHQEYLESNPVYPDDPA